MFFVNLAVTSPSSYRMQNHSKFVRPCPKFEHKGVSPSPEQTKWSSFTPPQTSSQLVGAALFGCLLRNQWNRKAQFARSMAPPGLINVRIRNHHCGSFFLVEIINTEHNCQAKSMATQSARLLSYLTSHFHVEYVIHQLQQNIRDLAPQRKGFPQLRWPNESSMGGGKVGAGGSGIQVLPCENKSTTAFFIGKLAGLQGIWLVGGGSASSPTFLQVIFFGVADSFVHVFCVCP